MMTIIPAIDLKGGRCVRLRQGRDEETTTYSDDPVAVAREWVAQGASRLHVVNLDGAFGRSSDNLEIIKRICTEVGAAVQCGGGIRSIEDADAVFASGPGRIVLGTIAFENRALLREFVTRYGSGRLIVAIDTRGGNVTTRGWTTTTDQGVLEAAHQVKEAGITEILHTNILHDGMMTGPDSETLARLDAVGIPLIASGGVGSADDIRRLVAMKLANLRAVIVGKALYEGTIDLRKALQELSHAEA